MLDRAQAKIQRRSAVRRLVIATVLLVGGAGIPFLSVTTAGRPAPIAMLAAITLFAIGVVLLVNGLRHLDASRGAVTAPAIQTPEQYLREVRRRGALPMVVVSLVLMALAAGGALVVLRNVPHGDARSGASALRGAILAFGFGFVLFVRGCSKML